MFTFAPHTRMRQSPYFAATVAAGVTMFLFATLSAAVL